MKPMYINEHRANQYKAACDAFAEKMKVELLANEQKGNFLDWEPHWEPLLSEIKIHVKRLEDKLLEGAGMFKADDCKRVSELCADIGNFLMMMDRQYGENSGLSTMHSNRCKKCGTPTFGPLCAKCKGEHV